MRPGGSAGAAAGQRPAGRRGRGRGRLTLCLSPSTPLALAAVCNTTELLIRENRVWPLYISAKTYVCCQLTGSLEEVWTAWVVAGVLSFVLAIAASARVIQGTLAPTGRAAFSDSKAVAAPPDAGPADPTAAADDLAVSPSTV